jgi:hypothetical protein
VWLVIDYEAPSEAPPMPEVVGIFSTLNDARTAAERHVEATYGTNPSTDPNVSLEEWQGQSNYNFMRFDRAGGGWVMH